MLRLAWRDVRLHPVRFAMSILAVVLGVSFVAGTLAMGTMLSNTFSKIVDASIDGAAVIHADTGEIPDLALGDAIIGEVPEPLADLTMELPEVGYARTDLYGPVVLMDKAGQAMKPVGGAGGGAPSMAMLVTEEDVYWSNFTIEGALPEGENQILLESATAERSGLSVGEQTTVILGQAPRQVTVTGLFAPEDATEFAGAILIGISRPAAEAAFAPAGTVGSITVFAAPGFSDQAVAASVKEVLPEGVTVSLTSDVRAAAKASIDELLGFINTFLLVFAAIALFVGSFMIANTFSMVVRQRRRETAVIRALGASPRQVFASFVGQAAIIGLVGSALGLAGGFGLLSLIRRVFDSMDMPLSGAIPWSVAGLVIPVVVGVAVSCLSAALPAWRASKVAPVDAMRDGVELDEKSLRLRSWVGLGLFVAGCGTIAFALSRGADGGPALGLGAAMVLVGLLAMSPALAPGLTRVLAWPFTVIFRPFGAMARRGVVRNPRRAANTAAALLIGTALVGATTVMASSADASVKDLVNNEVKVDFMVQDLRQDPMTGQFVSELEAIDGIDVFAFGILPMSIRGLEETMVGAVARADTFERLADMEVIDGSVSLLEGKMALDTGFAADHGWKAGDQLEVVVAPNTPFEAVVSTEVGLVYKSAVINTGPALSPTMLEQALPPEAIEQMVRYVQVAVALEPGADMEQARAALETAAEPYLTLVVMDKDEFATEIAGQITQMLNMIYALLALSVVIAVLGIVNTLALSVMERTREIGLMRAVGLGRGQLALTTVIEGVLIALFGAVLGLALGIGLAATLPSVFADVGLTTLVINWVALGALLVMSGVVGVVAALWPAIRAARLPVLLAVSYE